MPVFLEQRTACDGDAASKAVHLPQYSDPLQVSTVGTGPRSVDPTDHYLVSLTGRYNTVGQQAAVAEAGTGGHPS